MKQYTHKELLRMNITSQREVLRKLNKEVRTRAMRLKKAGFTGEMTTPNIRNYKKVPRDELLRQIEDLQAYTRNRLSTVKGMKSFIRGNLTTLHANGYTFVNKDNLAAFGQFMNMVRDIHGAQAFPSNEVANVYRNMERLNVSPNVIREKFGEYLADLSGITDLELTLQQIDLPEGRVRISSTEIKDKMKDLGL